MTPKQVAHVRICQRLLLIAQQPQRAASTEDQHVVKMTNLEKIVRQILYSFSTFNAKVRSQTS